MVQWENDLCSNLCFVEMGIVEVFTYIDGIEFILDYLYSGAIFNV